MPNYHPKTAHIAPPSEMGTLSRRAVSTKLPERYMPLLDAMGTGRSRWLRGVIVAALKKLKDPIG